MPPLDSNPGSPAISLRQDEFESLVVLLCFCNYFVFMISAVVEKGVSVSSKIILNVIGDNILWKAWQVLIETMHRN